MEKKVYEIIVAPVNNEREVIKVRMHADMALIVERVLNVVNDHIDNTYVGIRETDIDEIFDV